MRALGVVFGLYTRWFHRWALITGWAVRMIYRTVAAITA
jgi:SSS family solute:Na+ symporter